MSTDTPQFAVDYDENGPMVVQPNGDDPDQSYILLEKHDLTRGALDRLLFPVDQDAALAAVDALWERITAGLPTLRRDGDEAADAATVPALEATLAMPTLAEWHDDITRQLNESDEAQDWPMAAGTPVNLRLDHDTRTVALAPFEDDTEQEDGR
jgi:hypothetical protein